MRHRYRFTKLNKYFVFKLADVLIYIYIYIYKFLLALQPIVGLYFAAL
jgi:hypothetical protein